MHETKKNVTLLISLQCVKHPVSAQQLLHLSASCFWFVHTDTLLMKVLIKTVLFTEVCWDFSDMCVCGIVGLWGLFSVCVCTF